VSRKIAVTGAAGFIGGAIVGKLLDNGADVLSIDKVFIGNAERKFARLERTYRNHGKEPKLEVLDLVHETHRLENLLVKNEIDTVYHLAAFFGGREFVDTKQVECSKMLAADHNVMDAACNAGVERYFYASSACVYSQSTQDYGSKPTTEDQMLSTGEGLKSSDNLYGFAKIMGEMQAIVYHQERGMKTSTARFLTVYGPGEGDSSHAIAALTERALNHEDPFVIWGSGRQERGFTYIDDIAEGSIRACERLNDGTPVNLGTDERYSMDDTVDLIFKNLGWRPQVISHDLSKPEGPHSRALDIRRAKKLMGWEPKVSLDEGLRRTIAWHQEQRSMYTP
jgi:nucleoside-diphosphate-sugar epimerase